MWQRRCVIELAKMKRCLQKSLGSQIRKTTTTSTHLSRAFLFCKTKEHLLFAFCCSYQTHFILQPITAYSSTRAKFLMTNLLFFSVTPTQTWTTTRLSAASSPLEPIWVTICLDVNCNDDDGAQPSTAKYTYTGQWQWLLYYLNSKL